MKKLRYLLLICCAALPAVPATLLASRPELTVEAVWRMDTIYAFNEAIRTLNRIERLTGDQTREFRYAKAVTLLNMPTKTQGNMNNVNLIFLGLVNEYAGDDIGIASQYFVGRILQIHNMPANQDLPGARKIYRELFKAHPENTMAQLGYVRAVMLELYDKTATDTIAQRLRRLVAEHPTFTDKDVEKGYHLTLAQAYLIHGVSKERALEHYLAADKIGIRRWRMRSDVYVAITGLALETGRDDVAVLYCKKYLKSFQRDDRNYLMRLRLAGLLGVPVEQVTDDWVESELAAGEKQ